MFDSGLGVTGVFGDLDNMDLGVRQLGAQAIGVLVIWTVIFGIAFAFFKLQNTLTKGGIRPTAEMEIEGMDMPEMGALAYPEFEPFADSSPVGAGVGGGSPTMERPVSGYTTPPVMRPGSE